MVRGVKLTGPYTEPVNWIWHVVGKGSNPEPVVLAPASLRHEPHVAPAPSGEGWMLCTSVPDQPEEVLDLACGASASPCHPRFSPPAESTSYPAPDPCMLNSATPSGLRLYCIWCLLQDSCYMYCLPGTSQDEQCMWFAFQTRKSGCHMWTRAGPASWAR